MCERAREFARTPENRLALPESTTVRTVLSSRALPLSTWRGRQKILRSCTAGGCSCCQAAPCCHHLSLPEPAQPHHQDHHQHYCRVYTPCNAGMKCTTNARGHAGMRERYALANGSARAHTHTHTHPSENASKSTLVLAQAGSHAHARAYLPEGTGANSRVFPPFSSKTSLGTPYHIIYSSPATATAPAPPAPPPPPQQQ